jgi:diacylglycerol kinase family enzyme
MNVVLVYNAKSGGHSSLGQLKKLFADVSITITHSIKIESGFESSLKRHIQKGKIIAVVGGDGSISAVASLLKGTQVVMMPLPGGTLNHFTKDLGIPQSLPDALAYFKSAKKTRIDTAQVGETTFINNSSIGVYSDSLLDREEHEKKYGKWYGLLFSLVVSLLRFHTYKVEIDDKSYSTPLVFVGNNNYTLEGLTVQRSRLNEGILSIYIVIGKSRLDLFLALASLILGKKNVSKKLKSFTAKSLIIHTRKSIRVSRDGEHEKMTSPLRYNVNESSLYILKK